MQLFVIIRDTIYLYIFLCCLTYLLFVIDEIEREILEDQQQG